MNRRQTILIFIAFFITLAVITISLWLDTAMPYFKHYSMVALDAVEQWIDVLKGLLESKRPLHYVLVDFYFVAFFAV